MITGYNTDVKHRGVVFHVQTEDKGLNNPCVESLVYVGGQILHRRRTEYAQRLKDDEETLKAAILELLETQHRKLIAEIRTGKLDADAEKQIGPLADASPAAGPRPVEAAPGAKPESSSPSLDEVILDYLNTEAEQEHLVLAMDSMGELSLGSNALLAFHAKTSATSQPVVGAEIAVKLISTVSAPEVLGSGTTNDEGNLNLKVEIPDIPKGTAALIITAASEVGSAEIKHLI